MTPDAQSVACARPCPPIYANDDGQLDSRRARNAPAIEPLVPRLLGVESAGRYAGVSSWTIRSWIASGRLRQVDLKLRRVLVDRADLDALIERGKGA